MDKRPFRFRHVHKISVAFVMTAVVLVIGAFFSMGHEKGWFEPETTYQIELPSDGSAGLDEGADVMILGEKAGWIDVVELRHPSGLTRVKPSDQLSPDSIKLVAEVILGGEYTRFIGQDSEARLKYGLGGGGAAYIEVSWGKVPLMGRGDGEGGVLPFVVEKGVQDDVSEVLTMVTEKVGPLLDSLTATSDSVNELVTSFTSEPGAFQQTLVSMEATMEKVNSGDGAVNMILNDDGFRDDVADTLSKVNETVEELKLAGAEIKEAVGQFESETMPKIDAAIVSVPKTFEEVAGTTKEVAESSGAATEVEDGKRRLWQWKKR